MWWNKWPYWLRGGIIGALYLVVLVPLSSFCPEDVNCFTNIFVEPLFYPFIALNSLFPEAGVFFREHILAFLLFFWTFIGIIIGASFGVWRDLRKEKISQKMKREEFYNRYEYELEDEDAVPKPGNHRSELPEL